MLPLEGPIKTFSDVKKYKPPDPDKPIRLGRLRELVICIWGNIDCSKLLSFGSPMEVEESVKECIHSAGMNGGYVLTSSNSIHSLVKPENYLAMLKAAKQYGIY